MVRRAISPDELAETPYNHVIVDGGNIYMAGQVPRDSDGNIVGDDLETQSRKTFENIGILLEEVEKDFNDIAKITVYIMGKQETLDGYKKVYNEVFSEPYPCQTVIGTRPLGDSPVMIEIEAEVPME
ncbi:RidA family protein [Natronosalvus rutilus]|uniref:RidA family protein n=1 Tax=Natronosalvus rutilus TaxID=2953753 RepID=A0A9E7SY34_9EURY|nr:RidA family protein [Natronosalvus rutilus]UTF55676.1 RidA family protein [Natronosalvus rutilus]